MIEFPRVRQVAIAAMCALVAAPAFAQVPACNLDGLNQNQMKRLRDRGDPDLRDLPGVALGEIAAKEAAAVITNTQSTPDAIRAATEKATVASQTCKTAIASRNETLGNLSAHMCVAYASHALRQNSDATCRIDWIAYLGSRVKAPDQPRIRNDLADAWELKGKIQIALQDFSGAQYAYSQAVAYTDMSDRLYTDRLYNQAMLYERRAADSPADADVAIQKYAELSKRSDLGDRTYDVLRNWAVLVSKQSSASEQAKRDRWDAVRKLRSTPEANLRYAETYLGTMSGGAPDPNLVDALRAATSGASSDGDAVQSNARSVAWYYRAVFGARSAGDRAAWNTVAQYAGDGSAAPRASRLKCMAEIASGNLNFPSSIGACPAAASTPEQLFLRGAMILRASQFLPPACTTALRKQGAACTENYSAAWLGLVGQAKEQFSIGRNMANADDVIDWLEQGDANAPRLIELLKAGETVAQDWQTIRPGSTSCTKYPTPSGLDPKAQDVFNKLDLLNCAHR